MKKLKAIQKFSFPLELPDIFASDFIIYFQFSSYIFQLSYHAQCDKNLLNKKILSDNSEFNVR